MSDTVTKLLTSLAAALSISAIGAVAWLGFRDAEPAAIRPPDPRDAVLQRQAHFAAQEEQQRRTVVEACIPRLLGDNRDDRRAAVAMLFALYPNDAAQILRSVASSLREDSDARSALTEAAARADALAARTGEWAVVLTNDPTLADAQAAAYRSKGLLSTPVEVYRRDNRFMTLAVGFPNRSDAEIAAIALRDRVQDTAFTVNLREWCPNRTCNNKGYYDCGQ